MNPLSPNCSTEQYIRSEESKVHSAVLKRAIAAWEDGIEREAMVERFGLDVTREAIGASSCDKRDGNIITLRDIRSLRDPMLNHKITLRNNVRTG